MKFSFIHVNFSSLGWTCLNVHQIAHICKLGSFSVELHNFLLHAKI